MLNGSIHFSIEDTLTDPGSPLRANEDTFGFNDNCVFVIDGATGLSDEQLIPNADSDAAWFAAFAKKFLIKNIDENADPALVFNNFMLKAKSEFELHTGGRNIPRYAWPNASLAMLRKCEGHIEFIGLGDCTAHLTDKLNIAQSFCAMEKFSGIESANAATHLKRVGGMQNTTSLLNEKRTLEHLRQIRNLQNTPQSGIWTLGMVPEAADHLVRKTIDTDFPTHALLCSDGFNALSESYHRYSPQQMVAVARSSGLGAMRNELRNIERVEDPDATTFPRFKQSDDATALLITMTQSDV